MANSSKPLTEYFQPKPQQQSEQEQIVPDVSDDLDLDPSWFDDPVVCTSTLLIFCETKSVLDFD